MAEYTKCKHPSNMPDIAHSIRPLILTLGLDAENQARFERERKQHFPAQLNRIPAHVSLFHLLPGEEIDAISRRLGELAAGTATFPVQVHDVMRLGRGVAYALAAPPLDRIHTQLRQGWLPWLSRQDQQPFRPHVVVQNKVTSEAARELFTRLSSGFRPFTVTAASLLLWHYEGGPWRAAGTFAFVAPE